MSIYRRWALYLLGTLIAAIGLFLGGGGIYLLTLGGSWYFALAGSALVLSGLLIFLRKPIGAWIFGAVFIASVLWALWDVGLEFWPLFSRLFAPNILAFLVALAYPTLTWSVDRTKTARAAYGLAGILALTAVATFISAFTPKSVVAPTEIAQPVKPVEQDTVQKDWAHWGNTTMGTRFARVDQINKENVSRLALAWTARTGDTPLNKNGSELEDQNTPLQIGDSVFVCTVSSQVIALNADTGAERWRFDPKQPESRFKRCRGLGFYDNSAGAPIVASNRVLGLEACSQRLFVPTDDARLIAIDANTGKSCTDFGTDGTVDLKLGMGEVKITYYLQTSSPLVAGDLVVVGGRVRDNMSTGEPPGVVRAYDVHNGALVWAWDPGNPAITGLPPEGKTYTRGSPNVWSAMSYDPQLGLIYLPTGNATPDFWAGERTALDDKYSSSVVALEAKTGRIRWTFQATHHDIWDYDLPAQPLLYDIHNGNGTTTPALAQVSKQGEIFLLNRETGLPITRVEERPVPKGNVEGERYSPTQPFSVGMPSIGSQTLNESDMWGMTPLDQLLCRIEFKKMRYQGAYTPTGLDRSLQFPGMLGGMNWGSVSMDGDTQYMFINDIRLGSDNYLIPRAKGAAGTIGSELGFQPQEGTPFAAVRLRFLSLLNVPCQKPPFGTMSAVDLKTHKLVWQVPVGTVQDTGPLGFKMHLQFPIGMPTIGPSLATQAGLLFFAGTQDYYLRAFDSATGSELWKARLPVGSQSGPMTYISPKTGKQYILVTAGGARTSLDRGDYVLAYRLP